MRVTILAYYTKGQGLISQKRGNASYFYHYDGLGSIKALTDANQNIQASYVYDAWGYILRGDGNIPNHYYFKGRNGWCLEPETAFARKINLYYPLTGQTTRSLSRSSKGSSPPTVATGGNGIGPAPEDEDFWWYPGKKPEDLPPVPPPDPPRKDCKLIRDWTA